MSDTPMMRQYKEIKAVHAEEILFFRLGDFYEMFLDDAREASQILNLTLTARNGIPMCGIPFHAAKNYIKRLLEAGKKIAVCEQVKLPENGRGLAEREVTQIITPGTVVDDDLLSSTVNNYILSVACLKHTISLSYADISTGELAAFVTDREKNYESLRLHIAKLHPVEILIQESVYFEDDQFRRAVDHDWAMITRYPDWHFSISESEKVLKEHFGSITLQQFGLENNDPALASTGVLYKYLEHTAKKSLVHMHSIRKVEDSSIVLVDESSQRNLELVRNMHDYTEKFTLFSTIRQTRTASGTRLLRKWILSPLKSLKAIEERHFFIDLLYHSQDTHNKVRGLLGQTLDLERLCAKLSLDRASPRDLLSVKDTIDMTFSIARLAEALQIFLFTRIAEDAAADVQDLSILIKQSINEDANGPFSEGRVIRPGYNDQLDELRNLKNNSVEFLESYEKELLTQTGIGKIRIKYNKIIGYFIEVSKNQADKVPEHFIRRQTLVNGERYTTDKLIDLERKISSAFFKAEELEKTLFRDIQSEAVRNISVLLRISEFLSELDCFQSLAYTALRFGYSKPVCMETGDLVIVNGRHPVVEQNLPPGEFVPNSLEFSKEKGRFSLITGPNMSGKSTYLRQTALIVLLAHIGSYVPADSAAIAIHDKIFCRVGATDNLARGESTFLVEMTETAFILRNATPRSLIIMDEVGRGTSTQDGVAIAFAVMKRLLTLGAGTLFATHYHELTVYKDSQIQHLHLEVLEIEEKIVFTNKIRPGNASSSYGLHAAKLAGLPFHVLRTAESYREIHKKHETEDFAKLQGELDDLFTTPTDNPSATAIPKEYLELIELLQSIDIDEITPRKALELLYDLTKKVKNI